MAKIDKPTLAINPESSSADAETNGAVPGAIIEARADAKSETAPTKEATIRLSIDLSLEQHFCLMGIACDEGMRLKDFALKLLDQGRGRYTSNGILKAAFEQMRSKKRKAG